MKCFYRLVRDYRWRLFNVISNRLLQTKYNKNNSKISFYYRKMRTYQAIFPSFRKNRETIQERKTESSTKVVFFVRTSGAGGRTCIVGKGLQLTFMGVTEGPK